MVQSTHGSTLRRNGLILFHDVDGCLNPENGAALSYQADQLSQEATTSLNALGRALDESPVDVFVLNTGRSWQASKHLCSAIGSSVVQYALTEHATQLWNVATGTRVDLGQVVSSTGYEEMAAALQRVCIVEDLIQWFVAEGARKLAASIGAKTDIITSADKTSNLTFSIPLDADGAAWMDALKRLIEVDFGADTHAFNFHHSAPDGFVDVMPKVDKGMGLQLLQSMHRSDSFTSVAVGNGLNDLPMLEVADLAVCPSNSEPAVVEYCQRKGYVSDRSFVGATFGWLSGIARR